MPRFASSSIMIDWMSYTCSDASSWRLVSSSSTSRAMVCRIASSLSSSVSSSSRVTNCGSRPAAMAFSFRILAHRLWIVLICMRSRYLRRSCQTGSAGVLLALSSIALRIRLRISRAALRVKVIARMLSSGQSGCSSSRWMKRCTSTVVLPVPAPASTTSERSWVRIAATCSGVALIRNPSCAP